MSSTRPDLFQLLPAVYRLRDAPLNGPLENLVKIFQDVRDLLDKDISGLYENWFIETCAEWVVPYIGDLLRSQPLNSDSLDTFSARAYVAHTLSYRRRKGTVVVLEQLARDVTGWPARAVEFFQLLATTQYLNHLRPGNLITPDLRNTNPLELVGGPFEQACHTADVRGIVGPPLDPALAADVIDDTLRIRGKYNIPNIGLFLWRLQSYALTLATPRPVIDGTDGRYWFNQLGIDEPLFNNPQTLPPFTHLASEINVPGELRRRALYDELETRRQSMVDQNLVWTPLTNFPAGAEIADSNGNTERALNAGQSAGGTHPIWPNAIGGQVPDGTITWQLVANGFSFNGAYFGAQPVLQIFPSSAAVPIPPEQIMICDLSSPPPPTGPWRQPPSSKTYVRASDGASVSLPIQVSIDPALGRIAFTTGSIPATPAQVHVNYSYGFSGDLGGGPYNRIDTVSAELAGVNNFWPAAVSQSPLPPGANTFSNLTAAVAAWNALPATRPPVGVIAILDSHTYVESLVGANQIQIPDGSTLIIVAADWPSLRLNGATTTLDLVPTGVRPHIRGSLSVKGLAPTTSQNPGMLILNGLLVEGALTVLVGNLGAVQVVHSTLEPSAGGLIVNPSVSSGAQNSQLAVSLLRTISGPINLPATIPTLSLTDSILDAGMVAGVPGVAITAPGSDANIQSSTIFGTVGVAGTYGVRTLEAGNSIFTALLNVERTQAGCVRFCSIPSDVSKTPRRFHCQPDLALANITDPFVVAEIRGRLTPSFTSNSYGDPAYAQLSATCAIEIRSGADDGSEMGAFYFLKQPQRDTNLRVALLEYLRFGLQAGIFYVT